MIEVPLEERDAGFLSQLAEVTAGRSDPNGTLERVIVYLMRQGIKLLESGKLRRDHIVK